MEAFNQAVASGDRLALEDLFFRWFPALDRQAAQVPAGSTILVWKAGDVVPVSPSVVFKWYTKITIIFRIQPQMGRRLSFIVSTIRRSGWHYGT
jgi:hypothetical protein